MNCCKSYDEVFEYAKKVNYSNELFTDEEGTLTVYSQRLDYKYFGCAIYDMCRSQLKPNGDYSSSSEYVCEIWLMKQAKLKFTNHLIISLDILFTIHKNYAKINVCF